MRGSMTRIKQKPFRRHQFEDQERHWLGDGIAFPDTLLFDVNPILFALDAHLAHSASQIAHSYDGDARRPLAVVFSRADCIPWHVGLLRKQYDTCICAGGPDPILDEIAEHFDITVFEDEVPEALAGSADFVMIADSAWPGRTEFEAAVERAFTVAGEQSRVCCFVCAEGSPDSAADGLTVRLADENIALAELVQSPVFQRFNRVSTLPVPLKSLSGQQEFGVPEFAKRHRDFFGKFAYDLLLARVYESDFQDLVTGPDRDRLWAVLITGECLPE